MILDYISEFLNSLFFLWLIKSLIKSLIMRLRFRVRLHRQSYIDIEKKNFRS